MRGCSIGSMIAPATGRRCTICSRSRSEGHRLGVHDRQRAAVAAGGAVRHRLGLAMYYVPAPQLAYDSVRFITDTLTLRLAAARAPLLGLDLHRGCRRRSTCCACSSTASYKAPREVTWLIGVVAVSADPRVLAERLSAAVGSEGVLGDDRHHQHRDGHAADRRVCRRCAARRQPSRRAHARALV